MDKMAKEKIEKEIIGRHISHYEQKPLREGSDLKRIIEEKREIIGDTIDLTAKTILEDIEGKLGNERTLYKNDEDITKGNIVIDLIEGGKIVCYIGLKRIVLFSLDLDDIKEQFGVKRDGKGI